MRKHFDFSYSGFFRWSGISLLLTGILSLASCSFSPSYRLDLSGSWGILLDTLSSDDVSRFFMSCDDSISLPGTTDEAELGFLNSDHSVTNNLSRLYQFEGKAVYSKEISIPENWKGRLKRLVMERTKPTIVYVDGRIAGSCDDITTAQIYDLTPFLAPGKHILTIVVDNAPSSVPSQVYSSSHAYSSSTQTNWNGIIGSFFLESIPERGIRSVRVSPLAAQKTASVRVALRGSFSGEDVLVEARARSFNSADNHVTKTLKKSFHLMGDDPVLDLTLDMGLDALLWSEFTPALYHLEIKVSGKDLWDKKTAEFGLRDFKVSGKQFMINDLYTFLRGKHDACVFPLTGYPPMDVDSWRKVFQTAKEYGINHYRFHSWCPPQACFEAADLEGIYLQPELPIWGTLNKDNTSLMDFLIKEGTHIQDAYGNHASFVMMAMGNEMGGTKALDFLVDTFRSQDDRHLIASGSNNNLGRQGPQRTDDYFTTCRVGVESEGTYDTQTRASFSFADAPDGGYLNHVLPNTKMDFSGANQLTGLPVISHETGQFQIYPSYSQIEKYTGVLKPWNLETFRSRLEKAGLKQQAEAFFESSGKWAVELYKADMEMNLRTPDWGGFQLLDLQDYPGQGSAYVGILDAFMDSKGLVSPESWRMSCSPVTILAAMDSLVWSSDGNFKAQVLIPNYGPKVLSGKVLWQLKDSAGQFLKEGALSYDAPQGRVECVGECSCPLASISEATKLTLSLALDNGIARNSYSIWVYPGKESPKLPSVKVTNSVGEALLMLSKSEKVLLMPSFDAVKKQTVGGLFQTDYWNYKMFKSISESINKDVSPGTLGLLVDSSHPSLSAFPTDGHTSWQWFRVVKNSRPLILDGLEKALLPIVQVVDNVERNHFLGLVFEMKVEEGSLMVVMADLLSHLDAPEVRQLYASLLQYMDSDAFRPSCKIEPSVLRNLFHRDPEREDIGTLYNISKY